MPAAQSKGLSVRDYYWYVDHSDDNSDQYANFKDGEGYYGSHSAHLQKVKPLSGPSANKIVIPDAVPPNKDSTRPVDERTAAAAANPRESEHNTTAADDPLSVLEQRFFTQTYAKDPPTARLNRLEQLVFGEAKSGDLHDRVMRLVSAVNKSAPQPGASNIAAKDHTPEASAKNHHPTAAALVNEGRNEYMQKAFHAAEESFGQAVGLQPANQDAHYWLGMAKLRLLDYEGAQQELRLAFQLNPFSDEGKECRARLLDVAATIEKLQLAPVDSPKVVRQTMAIMSRQAASLQAQKFKDAQAAANFRVHLANLEAGRRGYVGGVQGWAPGADMSNRSYMNVHHLLADGRVQALHAHRDGVQRARHIQESQNDLLHLLSEHPRPGQPQLRALGTNLYVRYYGKDSEDGTTSIPPSDPPLKATAQTLAGIKKQPTNHL
jgi:tetratricopeptide (TPR) repeat protein